MSSPICPGSDYHRGLKMFQFAGHTLDVARSSLRTADRDVELRPKAFEVLRYLVENADRLVTKEELMQAVWPNVIVTDEALTHCVSEARQAIGDGGQTIIKTVPRRGYRLAALVSRIATSAGAPPSLPEVKDAPSGSHAGRELDRPSVAVLPFANLSGDPQQDYFSDGTTEDITTELSRFSELLVIARNSAFQYKGKAVDIRQVVSPNQPLAGSRHLAGATASTPRPVLRCRPQSTEPNALRL